MVVDAADRRRGWAATRGPALLAGAVFVLISDTRQGTRPGASDFHIPMTLDELTLAHFTPCVGQTFLVRLELPERFELELIEATPSRHAPSPGRKQSFALLFRAPPQWNCVQLNYPLAHPGLGEFTLFLVPVGRDARGTELEAVFNFG